MALSITSNFPGGNVAGVDIVTRDGIPEVRFASDPCGGAGALWFYFRIEEAHPDPAKHTKIRLTWTMIDSVYGGRDSGICIPVTATPGHTWSRLKQGDENRNEHGLREISWLLPHPSPVTEVAFCFPYGAGELDNVLERARDFWRIAPLGISQGGRIMKRVYHDSGVAHHPGVYIMARQHAGETPGSWVLDGFLRQWTLAKKGGYSIWTMPFADIDGATWGWFGRDHYPHALGRAWGDPPRRHEALVIQQDLLRWKASCKPLLVLDLQATGAFERDGVYAHADQQSAEETKWCNVIRNELKSDYAAAEFLRVDQDSSRSAGSTFIAWARQTLGVPAIRLLLPYTQTAAGVLTQKSYREIGQRLALAITRRG